MGHGRIQLSRSKERRQRGVALITTLLLLMLLSGLALAMAWSAQGDMLVSGYYRNFRGSFYAADSGLTIVRQALLNEFVATSSGGNLPNSSAFAAGSAPLPSPATENNIAAAINASYGSFASITGTGTGQAVNSWPEKFKIDPNNPVKVSYYSCTWTSPTNNPTAGSCTSPPAQAATFNYTYQYQITVLGQSRGTENTSLYDWGYITLTATTQATATKKSFAGWGMFIDQYALCGGGDLVPGTITGPVFTNGAWNFSNSGKYIFTDPVGQAGAQAGYDNGSCVGVAGPSGNGVSPTFQQGFSLGQPKLGLPTDSYNQEQAVLDGKGMASGSPSNSNLNANLKNISGTPYPTAGASSGVFLPYSIVNGKPTFTGGGIYVQGNASVKLSTSGSSAQVYTITQGSTTTTVTVDPVANTTTMVSGSATTVITGVPQQFDPTSGADLGYDTMLYVNGSITALSGPAQGVPAIQNGTALTVTAASNVTITGDILYTTEPVVTSGTNIDQLIPANNTGQALGIFTAGGNINMANAQSNGNLEIDASLATISQGGSGGLVNTGNAIGTLTIVGGRIQNTIQNINTTTRNVLFDKRFGNGFAPPWFPSTSVTPTGVNSATYNLPTAHRMSWENKSTLF